jgi:hypothetical protein
MSPYETNNKNLKKTGEWSSFENVMDQVRKAIHSSRKLAKLISKYLAEKDEAKKRTISRHISLLLKNK